MEIPGMLDVAGRSSLDSESMSTPFESWCEQQGTHPEAPGAWEVYRLQKAHLP